MDGYVKIDRSFGMEALLAVVLAIFFVGFSLVYTPFNVLSYYDTGGFRPSFHLLMTGAIILVVLMATRSIYHVIYARRRMLWWRYALWCLGEIAVTSLFAALYAWLFKRSDTEYFEAFSYCFRLLFLTLVFPYTFHVLYQIIREEDQRIEELLQAPQAADEVALIKFNDEHGRFKLAIDADEILYLQAEVNYVRIYYLEAGKVKSFSLRNSLKSVEPLVAERGIIRCHRSYFVNPRHVKVLRKDKYGFIVAELNIPEVAPIPISKNYYEKIAELL